MPKRDPIAEKLARLSALRAAPSTTLLDELRPLLGDKSGLVVALAAKLAGEQGLIALVPDLEAAFFRLADGAGKVDPGCRGKLAIAEALRELDVASTSVFARGVTIRQLESSDTAIALRVCSAGGLLQQRHPFALLEVAPLLADREANVRAGVAATLGGLESEGAEALLRLRVAAGDDDADVVGACLQALLRSSFDRNVDFVLAEVARAHAADAPAIVQLALLALGEARRPAAIAPLLHYARTSPDDEVVAAALVSLALMRLAEADVHLFELVESGPEARAVAAVQALRSRLLEASVATRLRALVDDRGGAVRDKLDTIERRG